MLASQTRRLASQTRSRERLSWNTKRSVREPVERCFDDCASGSLPAVSFVDPEAGLIALGGQLLEKVPLLGTIGAQLATHGGSQEDPQDMYYGEAWAHRVVQAVLHSPLWPRTLLIYTYDEHGGYYDHVPPPPAIAPDSIPPKLSADDAPAARTSTDRGYRPLPSRRTPSPTASATSCTTTPRSWRQSRRSGTWRRSPAATRTPRPCSTSSTSSTPPSSIPP